MSVTAAIISAIASAATATASMVASQQAQKKQNIENRRLTELNNQQQIDLVNLQNEYNSPSSQMARYKSAGLNPLLAVGNAGNQSSVAPTQAPQVSYNSYVDKLSSLANLANQWMQIKQADANIENINSATQLNNAKIEEVNEKVTDWRFRNLFGLSNAEGKAKLLALQGSKLYNDLSYQYGVQPILFNTDVDTSEGSQSFYTYRPLEHQNGMRYAKDKNALNFQKYGADLRELTYEWDKQNRYFGLGPNSPWWASFGVNALYNIKKRFHY